MINTITTPFKQYTDDDTQCVKRLSPRRRPTTTPTTTACPAAHSAAGWRPQQGTLHAPSLSFVALTTITTRLPACHVTASPMAYNLQRPHRCVTTTPTCHITDHRPTYMLQATLTSTSPSLAMQITAQCPSPSRYITTTATSAHHIPMAERQRRRDMDERLHHLPPTASR